jgi:hypothetical protein
MSIQNAEYPRIAVVGGGAAGLFAAGTALSLGAAVTVFEHMPHTGTKLRITGKGRCNVTNDCTPEDFLAHVITNPRFLYSAIYAFSPSDTKSFFERMGVPLKTERGQRVFPVSDKAMDIVEALRKYAHEAHCIHEKATALLTEDGRVTGVRTSRDLPFDAVIMATGGASYPMTGSDGSGYRLAQAVGHTVTPLTPSLVPLTSPDRICSDLQGLSLKNVSLTIRRATQKIYEDFGEMLFTHFGLSGPMILSASAHLRGCDFRDTWAEIDLKPSLDTPTLDARLLSDFKKNANKDFANELSELLPQKMILPFSARVGIDPHKKVHDITREERRRILDTLKSFRVQVDGFRPLSEAIVTAGGVDVREVSPKTMMSRKVKHLYFAGEILDLDAYTGGYNLQIAFSTAHLAAQCAVSTFLSEN